MLKLRLKLMKELRKFKMRRMNNWSKLVLSIRSAKMNLMMQLKIKESRKMQQLSN